MTIIIAIFFVIFYENVVLYILVEFESDRMSPRESAKNGRNGAHGLNWKIFVHSEFRFEIHDKNYPMKKNFMSLRPFWNFTPLTTWEILVFLTLWGSLRRSNFFCLNSRSFKEYNKIVFLSGARWSGCFQTQNAFFSQIFSFWVSFSQNIVPKR